MLIFIKKYKNYIMSICLVLLFFFLVYCNTTNISPFTNINEDGSFVLAKEKIAKDFSSKSARKFDWYMDAYCGDCIKAHKGTSEFTEKAIKNGELEIKYHPLNFLSHHSGEYSVLSAAYISGVAAAESSEVVEKFLSLIFDNTVKEENKGKSREEVIKYLDRLAELSDVNKKNISHIHRFLPVYEAAINKASVNIRKLKKWAAMSPKEDKSFFVPFIVGENGKALLGDSEDVNNDLLKPLKGVINCNTDCQ